MNTRSPMVEWKPGDRGWYTVECGVRPVTIYFEITDPDPAEELPPDYLAATRYTGENPEGEPGSVNLFVVEHAGASGWLSPQLWETARRRGWPTAVEASS